MPYSWSALSESWQRLLRRSTLVLALKVAGALAGYGFVYVALRRLGAGNYGYFELAFTVLSILSVVAKWGLDGLLLREIPARTADAAREVTRQALWASLLGSLVLAGALSLAAPWLASAYGGFTDLWRATAVVLPLWTLVQVWSEVRRAQHRYLGFGLLQSSILLGLVAAAMALLPWFSTVERVLWGLAASAALFLGRGWLDVRPSSLRSLWAFRGPATAMFLTGTLFMVMTWTDTLMLGYFLTPEDVGAYRVAFKIGTLITFVQFAVNASLGPRISELWSRGERAELQREVRRVALLNSALGLPAFVGIMVLAPWLLSFFNPDFGIYSGTLRVLALGQLVNALCGPVMYLLNMTGHEQSARRTMTVASIANVIGNFALIPWLGVEGAAWATSGTMILWNVWALVAVYRKTGIRTLIFVR
jgi:O-antigen/teichoic acid export membrane protein